VKLYHEVTNGVIDIQEIFLDNGSDSNYFISGPPAMIKASKNNLITKGVSVTNILTDDWE
jgi:NAD(P)H-flavin reductase